MLEDRTLLSAYVVDSLTDTGAGSGLAGDLRYCVTNATSGSDTITFAPGLTGTISLQSPLPTLNASVAIQGAGANLLTVSGDGFAVGNTADVLISGLTIANAGTALDNTGTTILSACTVTGNSGRGISNSGNLTINNSTISGNAVLGANAWVYFGTSYGPDPVSYAGDGMGGGIYMASGTLSINSSTIADNMAYGGDCSYSFLGSAGYGLGGGLYIAGGTVSINNSTFADNQAIAGVGYAGCPPGRGYGGGIFMQAGAVQMHDTIVADDSATTTGPDLHGAPISSLGYNLIGNSSGGSGYAASDLLNVNPQIGPLQNNGGPTQTMALLAGSPAIDAGDNANAPAYDQRGPGYPRIVNGVIDIGAFEVQNGSSNQASSLAVAGFPSVTTAGAPGTFTVTARNADGSTDTAYTGTVHFTSSDPRAALPANYTFTPADAGRHTFSATLFSAGNQSITATDTMTAGLTGTDSGIGVNPAGASQLAFGQQPSTTTAGQAISPAVAVDVEDPYGNVVSSDSSTVTLTLSSGTFAGGSATAAVTASGGVATFSTLAINKAGGYSLTATDGSLTPASSGSFTINPAAASKLVVTGFPSPTTAGALHTFTVTAMDPYGNVATGYADTVHFTSSDAKAVLPANYTFTTADAGRHTFSATLKTAGTQSLTASDTTTTSLTGTDGGITVKPAAASKFALTGPSSVSAGVPFRLTLTVEDAYGNVVTGYTGTVHFRSSDRTAGLPANYTFGASDQGVHTFTGLVLHMKGKQTITVTDTLSSALTATDSINVG
jgi:hypothetical protein